MNQELVTYIKDFDPFVDVFAIDFVPHATKRAVVPMWLPEHKEYYF